MSRKRPLRPEERQLWQAVALTATPIRPDAPMSGSPLVLPAAVERTPLAKVVQPILPFRVGERLDRASARDVAQVPGPSPHGPLRMDAKAFARMSRGKLVPDARIDLHGMTLAEAHPELVRFVLNAQAQGLRLVLVITGKGRRGDEAGPVPQRQGVLRQQVPVWLSRPPLGPVVQQVAEAHQKHGGGGACYVYLRRPGRPQA